MTTSPILASSRTARGLTLDQVWVAAALILLALRPLLTPIPPHDFWWHLATGRLMVQQGQIPSVDTFSFTRAGEAFFNQSWLAQLLMYGLYSAGGLPLVLIVQALVVALAYGLLLRLCILRTGRSGGRPAAERRDRAGNVVLLLDRDRDASERPVRRVQGARQGRVAHHLGERVEPGVELLDAVQGRAGQVQGRDLPRLDGCGLPGDPREGQVDHDGDQPGPRRR